MNRKAKILLPVLVLAAAAALTVALIKLRPPVERRPAEVPPPLVRVVSVEPRDVELTVRAQGTVLPGIESSLVAQVAGRIDWVSPQFAEGGLFGRGDLLVRLEEDDARLAVSRARAELARARTRLELAEAEAEQARLDWQELGRGEASRLTLREPQLAEARADLDGAEASLEQAELNLRRTRVLAPYDGRVRSTGVDMGEYVAPGTPLAEVFSTEYAEVRLPVTKEDLGYLRIDLTRARQDGETAVELRGELAGERYSWPARIVRAGGELDAQTRMLPLFARIDDPFARASGAAPLPMGLYVRAEIRGRTLPHAVVLPRAALRGDDQILVVDTEDRLRFRDVEIARVDRDEIVLRGGVEPGERVCISPLAAVTDGMEVRTLLENPTPENPRQELL